MEPFPASSDVHCMRKVSFVELAGRLRAAALFVNHGSKMLRTQLSVLFLGHTPSSDGGLLAVNSALRSMLRGCQICRGEPLPPAPHSGHLK